MNLLKSDEYPAIYAPYVETVLGDVLEELKLQEERFVEFIEQIPSELENYSYSPEKWNVKQVLCHVVDTERVMAYRALRFARNDMTSLAEFNPDLFVENGNHEKRSLSSIAEEFSYLRKSNFIFFSQLSEKELERKGMASGRLISVRALLYVIAGHLNHHRNILNERYFKSYEKNDLA
ncbi:MAG TPA: DinB family protein [Candidatus Sphingobacterium stercoripullorum]|uniref:DinB family protein n=1 Tax=Candidatus Sphingobacterium stercoripullorum TaxID=2838759 RepID=A0A9D1W9K4_9SPHI|nr:DinB family protein [Candidatus Sphingobacterium stercoripullorum]